MQTWMLWFKSIAWITGRRTGSSATSVWTAATREWSRSVRFCQETSPSHQIWSRAQCQQKPTWTKNSRWRKIQHLFSQQMHLFIRYTFCPFKRNILWSYTLRFSFSLLLCLISPGRKHIPAGLRHHGRDSCKHNQGQTSVHRCSALPPVPTSRGRTPSYCSSSITFKLILLQKC